MAVINNIKLKIDPAPSVIQKKTQLRQIEIQPDQLQIKQLTQLKRPIMVNAQTNISPGFRQ